MSENDEKTGEPAEESGETTAGETPPEESVFEQPAGESTDTVTSAGTIEVIIPDDKQTCRLKVVKSSEGDFPGKVDLLKALQENNVSLDLIKNEEVDRICSDMIIDEAVVVAEGRAPEDGEDGCVKYHFKTDMTEFLQEDEHGKVDYKAVGFIQQVKSGEVLAELVPPGDGLKGVTVTGEEVDAKPGAPAQLQGGNNTKIPKDKPGTLIATVDGAVSLKRGKATVDPFVVIDGDIDYSTGNIDFKGAVMVKGGVKSGFMITSLSDVTVNDVVEDAVIEAEGNVVLKGGFVGKGTGRIKAGGDVLLPFAENQSIHSGKNVIVSEALLHCVVEADGRVEVSGGKGIIGGSVSAYESIDVQSAGSQTSTETVLSVGVKQELREKMERFKKTLTRHNDDVEKIKKALSVLEKIKLLKGGLPPKQQKLHEGLLAMKNELGDEVKKLAKTKTELDEAYAQVDEAFITIHQKIYPGVKIMFGKMKKTVQDFGTGITFKMKDNAIAAFKKT